MLSSSLDDTTIPHDDANNDHIVIRHVKEMNLRWVSMNEFRGNATTSIENLCPETPSEIHPRLAKDEDYAKAVIDGWNSDILQLQSTFRQKDILGARVQYIRKSDGDNTPLGGYMVTNSNNVFDNASPTASIATKRLPAIILFHTGAGPQDVFLRWKADMIARDEIWGDDGCIVFIADLLSDSTGWTWRNRERYDKTRSELMQRTTTVTTNSSNDEVPQRYKLRETIYAIMDTLHSIAEVDNDRIGAMGWCLGGHPILEMGRMNLKGVTALATFHGVFDGIEDVVIPPSEQIVNLDDEKKLLICNGMSDPFVSQVSLEIARNAFESHSWNVEIVKFDNVKHGFTNPAQDCNPSDAFAFNENAANTAWTKTKVLFQSQLVK
jgi:dienelactone hydrolase